MSPTLLTDQVHSVVGHPRCLVARGRCRSASAVASVHPYCSCFAISEEVVQKSKLPRTRFHRLCGGKYEMKRPCLARFEETTVFQRFF